MHSLKFPRLRPYVVSAVRTVLWPSAVVAVGGESVRVRGLCSVNTVLLPCVLAALSDVPQ